MKIYLQGGNIKKRKGFLSIILALTIPSSAFAFTVNAVTGASGETVYVRTTGSNPTCYMWTTSGGTTTNNGTWHGVTMTKVEDNIYSVRLFVYPIFIDKYSYVW